MKLKTECMRYYLLDVISALQKDIRRGNEKEAMKWAMLLIPKYEKYVWRRLMVIANEDIGMGNPNVFTAIPSLGRQFLMWRERGKNGSARLVLANAILLLCRSPKSRMADHLQRVVCQELADEPPPEIPDYAQDNHTQMGRAKGRKSLDFWVDVGCKLVPEAELEDPHRDLAEGMWKAGKNDSPDWPKRRKSKGPDVLDLDQLSMF